MMSAHEVYELDEEMRDVWSDGSGVTVNVE